MKKIFIACILLLVIVLAGCSGVPTGNVVSEDSSDAGYTKSSNEQPQPANPKGANHEQVCY